MPCTGPAAAAAARVRPGPMCAATGPAAITFYRVN